MYSSFKKVKGKKLKNSYDFIFLTEECMKFNVVKHRPLACVNMGHDYHVVDCL